MEDILARVAAPVVSTGVSGLDHILSGGLIADRLYLLEGHPGSGKTTLALQFLLAGVAAGESALMITLSENQPELEASAASHGWSLDGLDILEIIPSEESLTPDARYTMYHPSEVELSETTRNVLAEVARRKPVRIVLDSLSELRLLAESPLRYRRQILALKQYFARQHCTVVFIDDKTANDADLDLHSLAHGVISLERVPSDYGVLRRRLQVTKQRGAPFREGFHDFVIRPGGVEVFPRLAPGDRNRPLPRDSVESGVPELDALLGGGLDRSTSMLIMGAAGTGKSSVATLYARSMAAKGRRAAMFLFDESIATLRARSAGLGMPIEDLVASGALVVRQLDPAETTPGEFAHIVRNSVAGGTELIVIDSLNGYINAMPREKFLTLHLHELLMYLGQHGCTTLLTMTQHGIVGVAEAPIDASYIADAVMLLRYFEAFGEVRQAISVIKKRTGRHERAIRELRFDGGISIGAPIRAFQGVLTGSPQLIDPAVADGVSPPGAGRA